jgi:hypothetical protein
MSSEEKINNGSQADGVPMPIVTLNRWMLVSGVLLALITQQPLITTILFLILLGAVIGGPRYSLVSIIGKQIFADRIPGAEQEDFKLTRFNNTIAASLLGLAQIAFIAGAPVWGWIFSLMVAIAAGIAIAGFCVGCFLFFQLRMLRYRLFGK